MAWLHSLKGGRPWFGKAEAKANGKRARRRDDRDAINEGYEPHPPSCACRGRGWFAEHEHTHSCDDPECVGCILMRVACEGQ